MWRMIFAAVTAAAVVGGIPVAAPAQTFPTRPITLVVPFPPGGSTGIVARVLADKMSETLGQPVVVDNRGGAGGLTGARSVAKSPPDGYTLLATSTGTTAIGPSLYPNSGFDPRKDFAPIGRIGTGFNALAVHQSVPARTVAELIAYAKQNPASLTSAPPAAARSPTSPRSCLRDWRGSSSRMFPIAATARPSPTSWAAISKCSSCRSCRRTPTSRAARCGRWA